MNASEKLETNIPTPEQQQLPKNPEGGFEIDDEQKFEQHRDKTVGDVESGASQTKEDGIARLDRTSHSYDLPEEDIASIREENQVDAKLKSNSDEIDKLTQSTTEQIKSVGKTPQSEQAPETQEGNIERERTIEGFQEKRGAILTNLMTSETVNSGLNLVPFAGGGKMLVESISGKELSGHKLSGKERIIHGAIGAGSLALDFTGIGEMSKAGVLAGRSVGLVEKVGAGLATKGAVRSARVFEKTAEFMVKHPDLTAKAELYADSKIRGVVTQIKDYQKESRPVEEVPTEESVIESPPISESNLEDSKVVEEKIESVEQAQVSEISEEKLSATTEKVTPIESAEIKESSELSEYLEKEIFSKFSVSKESEERALAEAPEDKKEVLQRSFQNTRDSLATMYELDTVEGRVDEQAYELAKRRKNAEVAFPYLSNALQSFEQTVAENGIEFKITPQDLRVSQKFVDINSLSGRFDIVGERLRNTIRDSVGEEKENEIFTKIDWEGLKKRAMEDISKEINSQSPVSRRDFHTTMSREQLTEMLSGEFDRSQSSGFLNSNVSPDSLRRIISSGGFKDVLNMSEEERRNVSGGSRALADYLEHRKMSEEALNVRRAGNEVVLYGTYAHDFNDEQQFGGASQYGDIFIKFKPSTEVSYTEGDSMNPRDSAMVTKKIGKSLDAKGFGFNRTEEYEYAESPRSRQVSVEHAPLAKALLAVDLKRQADMTGDSEIGRHYSYLEGQIRNPTFENIESINIPRSALENADGENSAFLDGLRNDPIWRDRINIIEK